MVLFNPKQSLLLDSYYDIGSLRVLLPVMSVLILYFHFFIQDKVNRDLLNFYLAALYILLIIFIYGKYHEKYYRNVWCIGIKLFKCGLR